MLGGGVGYSEEIKKWENERKIFLPFYSEVWIMHDSWNESQFSSLTTVKKKKHYLLC